MKYSPEATFWSLEENKNNMHDTSLTTLEIIKQPVFYGILFCRFKATSLGLILRQPCRN